MKNALFRTLAVMSLLLFGSLASGEVMTIVLSAEIYNGTNNPTVNTNYPSSTNILIGSDTMVEWGGSGYSVDVTFPDAPGSTNYTFKDNLFDDDSWDGSIRMLAGPVLLEFSDARGDSDPRPSFVTLKLTKQTGTFTPSTAVVIPSDAQGPVDILLESSTNLVSWVQAQPGTYGTSSQQRYFRVRAVRQ